MACFNQKDQPANVVQTKLWLFIVRSKQNTQILSVDRTHGCSVQTVNIQTNHNALKRVMVYCINDNFRIGKSLLSSHCPFVHGAQYLFSYSLPFN